MITYQYFEDENLIIGRFTGRIRLNNIIAFMAFLQDKYEMQNIPRTLYDIRDADIDITDDDLQLLISERDKYPRHNYLKTVFLVNKFKETALATLLAEFTEHQYHVHVCSTLGCSISVLSLYSSAQFLKERLESLSNNFI